VTSGGVPLTAGLVKFCNASATYCDNGAVLGSVWVTSSGTATLRRALRVGTTNVNAVFQPNKSYSKSTSSTTAVTVTGIDPDTSPLTFLSGGSNAYAIYAGDFNNDGYVDLAVYDTVLHTLQIFLGSSSGTFTKGASLAATDGAFWLVADFNRDGNLDLMDGYSGQVYLGAGNGTFFTGTTLPSTACSGYGSFQVAVADINGDGIPDIITTCNGYSNIYTLLGNGNGTFSAGPTTNASACFTPASGIGGFGVGDFNSDGKPDLFVTGYKGTSNSPNACTFLGTGTGTFTRTGSTFTDTGNNTPVAVGDFRNVGYPDVATASEGFEQTLLDNGTSIASFGTTLSYAPLQVADLNGDGNLDFVAVGASKVIGVPGKGNGTFGSVNIVTPSPLPGPNSTVIAAGDFYNIGLPAVAITTGTSPSYVEIMPMLKTTPPVVVTCAPSAGTFGSSATTCTAQTTAGATGLISITYNGTAWGSGDVNGSGAFSVSGGGGWNGGSYTITATYAGDENFNGASGSVNYTIDQLTPTITWATPAAITYGTPLSATQLKATASVPGTFVYTPAAGTVLGAGSQTLSVTFTPTDTTDYETASATVILTVNKAVLTVTANNALKAYGTANPAFTASYSGFQNGDTAAVLSGSPSFTTTATASSPVGAYSITPAAGSLSAANYTFVFADGSLTITPTALNVTANNASRTFDVANPAFTATYIGFVNGDTSASLTTQPTCTTIAVLLSPVGTYPIACSGAVDANYTVTYTAGTLTIGKVTLVPMTSFTFTSSLNPSTYGAGVTFTGTIPAAATGTMQFLDNGIAMGSPVAVSTGVATYTTAALPVGTQTITAQYSGDSNYNAATSPAVSQVVNKAILTVTANNTSKVYGTANPSFTPSYSGFVNGDTSAVLSGSPTLTTAATASSPVGTYPITAAVGTLSAANYTFVFTNGTLSITKATSTLSVSSTINPSTYGQTITFTLTVAGSGSGVTPTGTVTLTEGGTTLLGATTLNGSGTATYTTSTLPVGVNTLQLNYSGDSNYY
jgi:type IV secretory pathway protease TraF